MFRRIAGIAALGLVLAYYVSFLAPVTHAEIPQSANYRFDESSIGAGGLVQSSSANYQASSALSDVAIGNAASANYQIDAGSKTTNDPTLSFAVNNSSANFGSFTPSGATVTTATFSVSNYTSYGYVVQIAGTPPTNGNHTIPAMGTITPASSQTGVEQFGINLVANTSPASVGANPNYGPFGVGAASANYGTSNKFRYVSGETIATSPKSSGVTTYTISYLVNVASLTPGGQYNSNQTLIVTGTY
jgi:hypothetical protein